MHDLLEHRVAVRMQSMPHGTQPAAAGKTYRSGQSVRLHRNLYSPTRTVATIDRMTRIYTVFQKKLVHQAHSDNLVNSQRIFKILSLAHSAENLL